jgi:hypothetical protein
MYNIPYTASEIVSLKLYDVDRKIIAAMQADDNKRQNELAEFRSGIQWLAETLGIKHDTRTYIEQDQSIRKNNEKYKEET